MLGNRFPSLILGLCSQGGWSVNFLSWFTVLCFQGQGCEGGEYSKMEVRQEDAFVHKERGRLEAAAFGALGMSTGSLLRSADKQMASRNLCYDVISTEASY